MKKVESKVLDFIQSTKNVGTLTLEDAEAFAGKIDTGVYLLNAALSGDFYGGMEIGRITELCGVASSGKTAIATLLMEQFLKSYPDTGVVFMYETEGRVSESLSTLISPEFKSRVVINHISTVNEFNAELLGNLKPKLDKANEKETTINAMVVLDSLGNLASDKEMEDSTKGENSKQDFTRPKQIRKLFRTITIPFLTKHKIPLICTNHVYETVGSFIVYKKAGGGGGMEYLSNNIIEVKKIKEDDEKAKGEGKKTAMRLRIMKSLTLTEGTTMMVYFNNGIFNKYSSVLQLAKDYKLIEEKKSDDLKEKEKTIASDLKAKKITKEEAKDLKAELKKKAGTAYVYKDKTYTKSDLLNNKEVLEQIVKETNEAWRKEHSFMVTTAIDTSLMDEDDVEAEEDKEEA